MRFSRTARFLSFVLFFGVSQAFAAVPPAESTGELVFHKWSGELNVPDPVAVAMDPQGRAYVAATTRRKVADLDIREHRMWTADDVGLTGPDAKDAFYREVLAPGKLLQPRGSLRDHNNDGSIDWRDLTVHSERIYQLRDTDGDGTADRMTVFAEGFNKPVTGIAAGVMWHDGWLYATIAPDLWRLKDIDDDGVADIREVVVTGFGGHIAYAGHDMHGLSVGPDGRIYWSIGDKGANVTSREGRHFFYPNEGAVFRIEPDGSNFEVYAHGLRNVQEPAFDAFGNLINVDNDADMQGERERFVFIAEASDSGWRCNYQYMGLESPWMREGLWRPEFDGQAAYFLPPLASYSDGPAGFRYEPGSALGSGQRGHFLLTEFPSGFFRGFRAEPDGASFKMVDERIMNAGVMGVGMGWHPDGSLMMVDWNGGYALNETGAIWKIDAAAGRDEPLRRQTQDFLQNGFEQREESVLIGALAHADQRVRLGAQFELVRRGRDASLLAVATDAGQSLLARVHAIWGYGQRLRHRQATAQAILPLLRDSDPEIRAQTVKVLGDASHAGSAAGSVVPLLNDASPRVRLHVAIALGKWKTPGIADALFAMAARDGHDPTLRHAVVTALTGCVPADILAARAGDPNIDARLASVVALRRLASPAVAVYLRDSETRVVEEAARAIHDDLSIPEALPALATLLRPEATSEVVLRRALNANLRMGTPAAAARLLEFALSPAAPQEMREEAFATLHAWSEPPRLDRVDGWARTLDPAPIKDVLQPALDALLAVTDPTLKLKSVELMVAHALDATPAQITPILADARAPGDLRAEALRLMAARGQREPGFPFAINAALSPESPDELYVAALDYLLPDQPDRLVEEVRVAMGGRSLKVQQRGIALLAQAAHPMTDRLLQEQATALLAGSIPAGLQLDLLEAMQARQSAAPQLAAALAAYTNAPAAAARAELLEGGSVDAGRELALNHLGANCVACHQIESREGSSVGPALRGIGRQRDAAALLQSLLDPAAVISPGFGFISVTLSNGEVVSGAVVEESPETLKLRLLDGTVQDVARGRISSATAPISVMPPMNGILAPRELRDLVAYLQTLRSRS